jgi:hypothetical protein
MTPEFHFLVATGLLAAAIGLFSLYCWWKGWL